MYNLWKKEGLRHSVVAGLKNSSRASTAVFTLLTSPWRRVFVSSCYPGQDIQDYVVPPLFTSTSWETVCDPAVNVSSASFCSSVCVLYCIE